jgi:hypothetical protein
MMKSTFHVRQFAISPVIGGLFIARRFRIGTVAASLKTNRPD